MSKKRILVVEDERHIAEGIKLNLELQGHHVTWAPNGIIGLKCWQEIKPDIIILDIMMPELDGHGVLEKVRSVDKQLPILILSAKNESVDKVRAFKSGVDDYLGKPFSLDEFLLRVERLLERASWYQSKEAKKAVSFGENIVNLALLKAETPNGVIDLTDQEVKVLDLFFQNPKTPLKRSVILEAGWGYSEDVNTRTLDNFMVRFRKYFEFDPKKPQYFCSVRGVGYLWNPDGDGR